MDSEGISFTTFQVSLPHIFRMRSTFPHDVFPLKQNVRGNASSPDRYSQPCAVSTRDGGIRSAGFPPYGASRGTVTAVWRTGGVILMGAFGPRFHHPPSNVRDAVPDLLGVGVMCR